MLPPSPEGGLCNCMQDKTGKDKTEKTGNQRNWQRQNKKAKKYLALKKQLAPKENGCHQKSQMALRRDQLATKKQPSLRVKPGSGKWGEA